MPLALPLNVPNIFSFATHDEVFSLKSPDSGFKTPVPTQRSRSKMKGENPFGSFIDYSPMQSVASTKGADVAEPQTVSHEEQVKDIFLEYFIVYNLPSRAFIHFIQLYFRFPQTHI